MQFPLLFSRQGGTGGTREERHSMTEDYTPDQAVLLIAMDKKLAPHVKAAKSQLGRQLMGLEEYGADSLGLTANGVKVGKVTRRESKPRVRMLEPEDDALEYLASLGLTRTVIVPVEGWEDEFAVDGATVIHRETGEDASKWLCVVRKPATTAVTGCKPEDVMRAFGGTLTAATKLLEGLD